MGFFNWAAPIFKHLADRWTDKDIDDIANLLRPFVAPGGSLLDVGGGTGALASRLCSRLNAEITVVDPTPQMLSHVPANSHIRAVLGQAEAIPFETATFDAIIVTDAFHHFRNQSGALREFARVLKPGGGVVVLDLDRENTVIRVIGLGERLLREPATFLTPVEMCDLMAEHGITGTCTREAGASYRFVGTVESKGSA